MYFKNPGRRPVSRQVGSATIIAILLLTTIVSLILIQTLLISNTNLTDTLRNSDSGKALFLAESAIERASWQYNNGIACSALVEGAAVSMAGGSSQITNATPGAWCEITAVGKVNDTTRTIVVEIDSGSSVSAWAIGQNGVLLQRIGTSWTTVTSGTTQNINAVHCADSSNCIAVGNNGTVLTLSGGTWSTTTISASEDYEGIACAPGNPNYCIVVGDRNNGVARFWNGASWSNRINFPEDLRAITCPTTICYAVGRNGFVSRFNGTSWNTENSSTNEDLEGVDCLSASECWAVGDRQGNRFTLTHRTGSTTWTEETLSNSARRNLNAASCSSPTNCQAVGDNGRVLRNTGSGWTYFGAISNRDLEAIRCRASDNTCIATGRNGAIKYWDGSTWTTETSGTNRTLQGVFYLDGGGGGSVSIKSWREVGL